ncbi:hypothetical protein M1116_03005 [Patescibacteria group bacterium]|nr:hypothetical protein [Patescibacteria group bacterium]
MTTEKEQFRQLQQTQHCLRENLREKLAVYGEERPVTDPSIIALSEEIARNKELLSALQQRLTITTLQ